MHLAAAADVGEVVKARVDSEELNARGTVSVLEAARAAGVKRVVYASTIWVYSDVHAEDVDEDTPLRPPAHLYTADQARGRAVLPLLRGALRPRVHDPALRHPLRPARPAGRRRPGVRRQGAGGRAADDRRHGRAVAALRLRRGPRRGRRARARARRRPNRTYNLVGDEDVDDPRDRRDGS